MCAEWVAAPGLLAGELDSAAREQNEDEPGADGCRRDPAGERVDHPTHASGVAAPAGAGETDARVNGDGGNGRTGAGSDAEYPGRRRGGEEQRGETEDDHEPGHDERRTADERARVRPSATHRRSRVVSTPARAGDCTRRRRPRTRMRRTNPSRRRTVGGARRCARAAHRILCSRFVPTAAGPPTGPPVRGFLRRGRCLPCRCAVRSRDRRWMLQTGPRAARQIYQSLLM